MHIYILYIHIGIGNQKQSQPLIPMVIIVCQLKMEKGNFLMKIKKRLKWLTFF